MRSSMNGLVKYSLRSFCLIAAFMTILIGACQAHANQVVSTFSKERAWSDGTYFNFAVACGPYTHLCVMIDADSNADTGYTVGGVGADYMIEDSALHHFESGSGANWSLWNTGFKLAVESTPAPNFHQFSVPFQAIGSPQTATVAFMAIDSTGSHIVDPLVTNFSASAPAQQSTSPTAAPVQTNGQPPTTPIDPSGFYSEAVTDDGTSIYFRTACTYQYPRIRVLIDTDCNKSTGAHIDGLGADYMVDDGKLYLAAAYGGAWLLATSSAPIARSIPAADTYEVSAPLDAIGAPGRARVLFQGIDANGNPISDHSIVEYVRGAVHSQSTSPAVAGTIDDLQPGWIFSGMTEIDDDQCSGRSEHAGGSMTYAAYTFDGTGVAVYATTGPSVEVGGSMHKLGRMSISIDGKPAGEYSLFQAISTYQSKIFSVTGLTAGNHVIQLTAEAGWVDVDYIQVFTGGGAAQPVNGAS